MSKGAALNEEGVIWIHQWAWNWGPKLVLAAVVFALFWFAAQFARRGIRLAARSAELHEHLGLLLARGARIILLLLGLISALGTLGIDVSAVVAGLGLTGFALGFALRDVISNVLAGVLILLYRPFEIGSRIRVGSSEGRVTEIDLRYTHLESDEHVFLVPNGKLFTESITLMS
ncbi:MAG: mechanosensitive ion channel [Gammaproteobacteria bacterium]